MITVQKIAAEKRATIRRIKALVQPHLWASGYVTGPIGSNEPLMIWVPDQKGFTRQSFRLYGIVVDSFQGMHADGLILDGEAGGLATNDYVDLPLEDLLRVERWAYKQWVPR